MFLLMLSQFIIWDAVSLIQRQILWTSCVFQVPELRIFSDENKLQSTMEKGSELTQLLENLEPETLDSLIL